MAHAITYYLACRPIVITVGGWESAEFVDALPGDVFDARALHEDDADDYLWAGWIKPALNQKGH